MTTAKEADEIRDQIYRLFLRGVSMREIARLVGIDVSNVSRHMARIRRENMEWFQRFKEPRIRAEAYFKEEADRLEEWYRETVRQYSTAINPPAGTEPTSIQNRVGLLNTILAIRRDIRVHYRMVLPSMDEVYYRQQLEEINRAIIEKRQAEKVTPLVAKP